MRSSSTIRLIRLFLFAICFGLFSCAQVPKESVELSATVGRDMDEMHRAHVALVHLYYDRLLGDINRFIDDVYTPFQIRTTLADDVWKTELMNAIDLASEPDPTGEKQKEAFEKIEAFLQILNEEIESYRAEKTAPILAQKNEVLDDINAAYEQIHYANSIVTGHLASVVKVHETQNELLAKINLEDLRDKVSIKTADVSDKVGDLTAKGQKTDAKVDELIDQFEEIVNKFKN